VNAQDHPPERDTSTRLMTTEDAIAAGAMALFGEKYGDEVRVLSMGTDGPTRTIRSNCAAAPMSIAGRYRAVQDHLAESAVAAGVRRIEALTGEAARLWLTEREDAQGCGHRSASPRPAWTMSRACGERSPKPLKRLERELAEAKKALALGGGA
jgi:alanyl-tRNA synthetase